MSRIGKLWWICIELVAIASSTFGSFTIRGDEENPAALMKWHKVELSFDGPALCETDSSTFTDHRLDVELIRPDSTKIWVAGFFSGAGQEADTGNGCGNQWRVRLNPDMDGPWSFTARFRTGNWVAVAPMSNPGGTGGTAPDGESGTFVVGASDKNPLSRDFRGKGQLRYVNRHHCQFAESGEYFIKGGCDSPEDFIADNEIDNTPANGHDYTIHKTLHFNDADASAYTWKNGKGKGILGAIRYLAELQEMNNIYVILLTAPQGDAKDVWPWISTAVGDRAKYDLSKLDQWERVFSYGDKKGIHWNLLFTETENDDMICGNFNLCNLDRLYYREMIARFSHHHAVSWNVGEEYSGGDDGWNSPVGQHVALMMELDPYNHTYTCHTNNSSNSVWSRYDKLLGIANATSNQQDSDNYAANGVHGITRTLRDSSAAAGLPMVVYIDEANGPVPRCGSDMDAVRKGTLWANLMAGGAGVEWYFGYDCSSGWHDHNCLEDFTKMECVWSQTRNALGFFMAHHDPWRKPVPFHNMQPDDSRISGGFGWCLYGVDDEGKQCVVVYLRDGGSATVNVPAALLYHVGWMEAETGEWQYGNDIVNHPGGNLLFTAPSTNDWALLLYDWDAVCRRPSIDIVADGVIDLKDLEEMAFRWLNGDCCNNKLCAGCDLDASGSVDIGDMDLLSQNWLKQLGTSTITLDIFPADDACLEGGDPLNDTSLRVQAGYRISYLKFVIQGIPSGFRVTSAKLELTENGDPGSGTLRFFLGSDNLWTEETLTSQNAPSAVSEVSNFPGSVGTNQTISVDVTPLIARNSTYTIVITMDAGGNDIWFGSKESNKTPKLIIVADK